MKTTYTINYYEDGVNLKLDTEGTLPVVIQLAEAIAISHSSVAEIYQEQRKIVTIDRRGDK